jgi:hypothetical protein
MNKKKIIFVANDPNLGLGPLAYSGVFPEDFSLLFNPKTHLIVGVASKHLSTNGTSREFGHLVDQSGKKVAIYSLGAHDLAELEMKIDLFNLSWEEDREGGKA